MKHTRGQVLGKIAKLRRLYADGRLPENQIKDLEVIPGWSWEPMADKVTKIKVQVTNETIEMGPVRVQVTESGEPTTKKVRVRFIPSPDQQNVIQETRKQPILVQKSDGSWVFEAAGTTGAKST